MTQNQGRGRDKKKPNAQAKPATVQAVTEPVPALIESTIPEVVNDKPQDDEGIPKKRFTRWLYHRSQIILSVLTFAVVVFSAIQWWEYRNTRELEYRAYVVAKGVIFRPNAQNPAYGDIYIVCVNTGRTPALKGNIIIGDVTQRESPIPEDTVINPPEKLPSQNIFAPQLESVQLVGYIGTSEADKLLRAEQAQSTTDNTQKRTTATPAPLTAPTPSLIPPKDMEAETKKYFYAYGMITYEDIFKRPHRTRFCFYIIPGTSEWKTCPTFNDAN